MSQSLTRRQAVAALGTGAALLARGAVAAAPAGGAFADGVYTLPPLGYDYGALEPHLDAQTMTLHHDRHHAGYVAGLNAALKTLADARAAGDYAAVKTASQAVAFHGSGHFLHCLFWTNMTPGGAAPSAAFGRRIERDFGSQDNLIKQFSAAANSVEGSGWGILAYEPVGAQMVVLQAEKHQNLTAWGVVPLLVLDVWEHAYYLKYQNRRAEYVTAFWNVVDWRDVERRFAAASG